MQLILYIRSTVQLSMNIIIDIIPFTVCLQKFGEVGLLEIESLALGQSVHFVTDVGLKTRSLPQGHSQ